jgi:hypothetical protein
MKKFLKNKLVQDVLIALAFVAFMFWVTGCSNSPKQAEAPPKNVKVSENIKLIDDWGWGSIRVFVIYEHLYIAHHNGSIIHAASCPIETSKEAK